MGREITSAADIAALDVGKVVTLTGSDGETVNVALKTAEDEWGLAGQVSKFTTEKLFSLAVKRDGYTLAVLS